MGDKFKDNPDLKQAKLETAEYIRSLTSGRRVQWTDQEDFTAWLDPAVASSIDL